MSSDYIMYEETQILKEDWEILKKLEQRLEITIPLIDPVECTEFGFEVQGGRVVKLTLFGKALEEIPSEILKLGALKHLDLSENQLKSLPTGLAKLQALRHLDLEHNNFEKISDSIFALCGLVHLNLGFNYINSLSNNIEKLTNLEMLTLHSNRLLDIPLEIRALRKLEVLTLDYNNLGEIPAGVLDLTNLVVLYLGMNQISHLPEEINNLSRLRELGLKSNVIRLLPEKLDGLAALQELDLSHNLLESIPARVFESCPNLSLLNICANQITTLPESIGNLVHLEGLFACNNRLKSLPASFSRCRKLERIYFQNNMFREIPKVIFGIPHLEILYLAGNAIEDIPEEIGRLNSLLSLSLAQNRIDTLPCSIGQLKILECLFLEGNRLGNLPKSILNCKALKVLRLNNNPLHYLPKGVLELELLEEIMLVGTRLLEFPWTCLKNPNLHVYFPLDGRERDYYRNVWDFDPWKEAQWDAEKPYWYRYERDHDLREPILQDLGVKICARVWVEAATKEHPRGRASNKIVFKRGSQESVVGCVHTAIARIPPRSGENPKNADDLLQSAEMVSPTLVMLTPEEHFVSLNSFVAGIAEQGLANSLLLSFQTDSDENPGHQFGFDPDLQNQIVTALNKIAPHAIEKVVRKFALSLPEQVPRDWFLARLEIFNEKFGLFQAIFSDISTFLKVGHSLGNDPAFLQVAFWSCHSTPEIRAWIMDYVLHIGQMGYLLKFAAIETPHSKSYYPGVSETTQFQGVPGTRDEFFTRASQITLEQFKFLVEAMELFPFGHYFTIHEDQFWCKHSEDRYKGMVCDPSRVSALFYSDDNEYFERLKTIYFQDEMWIEAYSFEEILDLIGEFSRVVIAKGFEFDPLYLRTIVCALHIQGDLSAPEFSLLFQANKPVMIRNNYTGIIGAVAPINIESVEEGVRDSGDNGVEFGGG